jgi:hypothetical protein
MTNPQRTCKVCWAPVDDEGFISHGSVGPGVVTPSQKLQVRDNGRQLLHADDWLKQTLKANSSSQEQEQSINKCPYNYVAYINDVRLVSDAGQYLNQDAYTQVIKWLTQWKPINNYKTVLGIDENDCINILRNRLQTNLAVMWIKDLGAKPEHFEFKINGTEIHNAEFWHDFGYRSVNYLVYHKVVE